MLIIDKREIRFEKLVGGDGTKSPEYEVYFIHPLKSYIAYETYQEILFTKEDTWNKFFLPRYTTIHAMEMKFDRHNTLKLSTFRLRDY